MEKDELTVSRWQVVVNDNILPDSVAPELEVEDARMSLSSCPVLVTRVNNHLPPLAETRSDKTNGTVQKHYRIHEHILQHQKGMLLLFLVKPSTRQMFKTTGI